jgi:hypothetical protein
MASRLGLRRDYLTVIVSLSYLSPEIVSLARDRASHFGGPAARRVIGDTACQAFQGSAA